MSSNTSHLGVYCDRPNSLSALKAVANATSSGVFFMNAAIISTMAGRLHGSFRWNVQYLQVIKPLFSLINKIRKCYQCYLCKNMSERSLMPVLTCTGNFEARVFGYMNGESVSTSSRSSGRMPSSSNFRTPESDLSCTLKRISCYKSCANKSVAKYPPCTNIR